MKNWFSRNAIHFAITGIFILICFVYFVPAWQGKVLVQGDVLRAEAGQKEIMEFREKDGKAPLWTNSMFSGMPSYQIWVAFPNNIGTHVLAAVKSVLPLPMDVILLFLIGGYILFCSLRLNPWLAALGAIALTFSSYNFIYIEAGHSSKTYALAFFAPVLAGILLAFRGRYLPGAVLLAIALAMEIRVNHIQVTYYLFIAVLLLLGFELYHAWKSKTFPAYLKAIGSLAVAAVLAVAVNATLLWTTYEYGQETIRGKSNLTDSLAVGSSKGVDRDYAYQWSQGVGENLTFLIPNAYGGGASGALDADSEVAKTLAGRGVPADQAAAVAKDMPTYWGDKPFTHGPWYFGAGVILLFIFGLLVVKNRLKWWILSAVLLSIFLAFGRHLPLISDLFFNYFPLYNKFRAVESMLVIAAFLIPVLAILAVHEVLENRKNVAELSKKLLYSLYITGGITLVVALLPDLFLGFRSSNDAALQQQFTQMAGGDNAFGQSIISALIKDRTGLARTDAFRSLLFLLLTFAGMWFLIKGKLKPHTTVLLLSAVVLIDMWGVNRRYLNTDNFVEKSRLREIANANPREVDNLILMDKDPNYRVLDLTSNPFTNASTSYFHKSIGGYHAAKLMRYQEVIEKQFSSAFNEDVLDMLNTRYLITNDKKDSQHIQKRNTAAGNAWFVDRVTFVKDNDEEMRAINSFDPRKEAFVHEEFRQVIDAKRLGASGSSSSINLVSYRPDYLVYEYSAPNDVMAVFSEVWYDKGWNAYVDGDKIPHVRANYLLRAAQLPGGNHRVEFRFEPRSYYHGELISLIASLLLVLGLAAAIWLENKKTQPR